MSTAAAPTPALELQNYARTWAKSVAVAQGTIPGATCEVFAHAPASAAAFRDDDLWITANFLGELAGTVALRIGRAGARRLMPASGNLEAAEELSADSKAALLDWIHRAAVDVLASMQLQGGDQVQVELVAAPPEGAITTFWFEMQTGDPQPIVLAFCLDSATVHSLQSLSPALLPSKPAMADMTANRLGMLMDVELVVAVRFGGRRMLLKDILDLCAGSVVELDQQVQEPVDLLLDGKLIARGEVVVVDGNYGLRVTEVLSSATD
jgi:flagellar motor switch protein FliN